MGNILKTAFLLTFLLAPATSFSQDLEKVDTGTEQKIDRHGYCYYVNNASAPPLMVATKTPQEWAMGTNSFITNIADIPNVTIRNCTRTSTAVSWRQEFKCPNPYNRQFCKAARMSKDGKFAYILEDGDAGQHDVKLHVYRVNDATKKVTRAITVSGLSGYPTVIADIMASGDGSTVVTWERKYSSNGGHQTEMVAYKISGSTATRAASVKLHSHSFGGYTAGEMSDDGQFLVVDKLLYKFTGSAFVPMTLGGEDINWSIGGDTNDNAVKWSERLGGFIQIDRDNGRGYLISPNTSGVWQRIYKFSFPTNGTYTYLNIDVSDLGTKFAMIWKDAETNTQKLMVYDIINGTFSLRVDMSIPTSSPSNKYAPASEVAFSSGEGNYIFVAGFNAKEIRQYDARNLNLANLPIITRIPTPSAGNNGQYTKMVRSGTDHLLLAYWAGEDPVPLEVISLQEP